MTEQKCKIQEIGEENKGQDDNKRGEILLAVRAILTSRKQDYTP